MATPMTAPEAIAAISPADSVLDEDTDCGEGGSYGVAGGKSCGGGDNNGIPGGGGGEGTDGEGGEWVHGGGGGVVGGEGDEVGKADMDGLVCQYLIYLSLFVSCFRN